MRPNPSDPKRRADCAPSPPRVRGRIRQAVPRFAAANRSPLERSTLTLDEVADLLKVTGIGARRRPGAGLRARTEAKLVEIDAKLADLTAVRDTLRAALEAGCDDLLACGESPSCPVPFGADGVLESGAGNGVL
ncbi:MerR family DNA-binding protein [Nocardia cyriacigeorgica]|nr:MerR family DNA-binding protein [Nocardia cyriacigeorgica]